MNLYTSVNGGASPEVAAKISGLTEMLGGTFVEGDEHAEMNILHSSEVEGQTLVGAAASEYMCFACGKEVVDSVDGDTSVLGTPWKALKAGDRVNPHMDPDQFIYIPDYEAALGDEGIGPGDPWV